MYKKETWNILETKLLTQQTELNLSFLSTFSGYSKHLNEKQMKKDKFI